MGRYQKFLKIYGTVDINFQKCVGQWKSVARILQGSMRVFFKFKDRNETETTIPILQCLYWPQRWPRPTRVLQDQCQRILGTKPRYNGENVGQEMGQLISKFGVNIWDAGIKNLAVSHLKQTACIVIFNVWLLLWYEAHFPIFWQKRDIRTTRNAKISDRVLTGGKTFDLYFLHLL